MGLIAFRHSCESRNPASFFSRTKEKATTLDSRLKTSGMTDTEIVDEYVHSETFAAL